MLLLVLRFVKLLAVSAAFAGTAGAFLGGDLRARRLAVFGLGVPGIGTAWVMGFLLASERGISLLSAWILLAMTLSFFSMQVLLWAVAKEGRTSATIAALAAAPLVSTVALMVFRPWG